MRRLAILMGMGLLLATGCERGEHPGNVGKVAPEFAVNDGVTSVDLNKLRGKVVVLNLWASWCAPCVEELPSLLEMQRELPDVAVVGVSIDEDDTAYRRFLVRHQVDFLTVRDPSQSVNKLYGTVQIPETYIIDGSGVIRRKFIGAQDWTASDITDYLRRL